LAVIGRAVGEREIGSAGEIAEKRYLINDDAILTYVYRRLGVAKRHSFRRSGGAVRQVLQRHRVAGQKTAEASLNIECTDLCYAAARVAAGCDEVDGLSAVDADAAGEVQARVAIDIDLAGTGKQNVAGEIRRGRSAAARADDVD
jgi:hypothetical protein